MSRTGALLIGSLLFGVAFLVLVLGHVYERLGNPEIWVVIGLFAGLGLITLATSPFRPDPEFRELSPRDQVVSCAVRSPVLWLGAFIVIGAGSAQELVGSAGGVYTLMGIGVTMIAAVVTRIQRGLAAGRSEMREEGDRTKSRRS